MNEHTIGLSEEVLKRIDSLAGKIGVTVEQLWPWLVRQQYVEAIYYSIIALMLLTITITAVLLIVKYWSKLEKEDLEPPLITITVIIAILAIIFLGVGLGEVADIFNPEYWALKDLMRMIK